MILFYVWKGTCQWLMRYECLKNFVVTLSSESDLFLPLSPIPGPDSEVRCVFNRCNKWLCNDMIMFQVLKNSYPWISRYEYLKKIIISSRKDM